MRSTEFTGLSGAFFICIQRGIQGECFRAIERMGSENKDSEAPKVLGPAFEAKHFKGL